MNNFNKSMLILMIAGGVTSLTGCMSWKVKQADNTEFNPQSTAYAVAQPTKETEVPEFIASNIKRQPVYPIDTTSKLNGKIAPNRVPPTIQGKVIDND